MLYLAGQILLIVIFAALVGLALGWWSRSLMTDIHEENSQDGEVDPFGARSRLEQCHRDNAELRRELREVQKQVDQFERAESLAKDDDVVGRLHAAESRAEALLEDLQLRDDTIAVLEDELEKFKQI